MLAANVLAAGWGAQAWARKRPSLAFWYLLRAAQVAVAIEVVLGFVLLAQGERAPDDLHAAYGIALLVVALVSEGMRAGAAQAVLADVEDVHALDEAEQRAVARRVVLREMGVMTIGALLIVTLALRAVQTGG